MKISGFNRIASVSQILYILVSFFGTGNIASISSFDPNWVRCFVSTFSPFLMAALIIVKLLIPVLLVMCAVRQIHAITKVNFLKSTDSATVSLKTSFCRSLSTNFSSSFCCAVT